MTEDLARHFNPLNKPAIWAGRIRKSLEPTGPLTIWNLLFQDGRSPGKKRLSLKGVLHQALQYVDLSAIDFTCRSPTQMQLVDLNATGDVKSHFADFEPALQERLIRQAKHLVNESQVQMSLKYSTEGTPCVGTNPH